MKRSLLIFTMIFAWCNFMTAQYDIIDFEAAGAGTAYTWTVDQNGSNPAISFPINPTFDAVNSSVTVAEFTAEVGGQPWALTYTSDIDEFIFDATNSTIKIMVHKPEISNVGIKFEGTSAPHEILMMNTVTNGWEELTFDFSAVIGNQYDRIVIIPDFHARAQTNTVYLDNIQVPDGNIPPPPPPPACTTCICIDFEPAGLGQGYNWVMDQNGTNTPMTFPANPVSGGINTTPTVAEFTAELAGQPWALTYTDDIDPFMFDATNTTVTIMVYKPTISNVGIKFEGASAPVEILVPNTVVNEWEELTFDFSGSVGNNYSRVVIIPDFDFARAQDNTLYLDNFKIPEGNVAPPAVPTDAPTPPPAEACALSIFSDVYGDLPGTNFDPNWGQVTDATIEMIAGNNTLQYLNLNYQGTQFGSNQDVSGYEFLHVDFWTSNSTDLGFFLISPGLENEYLLTSLINPGQWVSVDIPLSFFVADLTDVFQFKVDGNGSVWFDNLYFHGGSNVELPAAGAATTITCTTTCEDGQWTYYEDPANAGDYLFAIEWDPANAGNNAAAKAGAQVVIDVDAARTMVDDGTEATWTMARYWNVTPGAALVDPVNVKFFYDAAEKTLIETEMTSDGRTPEPFQWFKTVGVDFDPATHVTGPVVTGGAIPLVDVNSAGAMEHGVLFAQFDGITSFSGGTGATGVGEASSPLPVEFKDFKAQVRGDNVLISWQTLTEVNNDYFELERSNDGKSFDFVNMVQGYGTSSVLQSYQYLDKEAKSGTNYYRLKQVDFNGDFAYSNIVSVRLNDKELSELSFYPSPVKNNLIVEINSTLNEQGTISISNSMGQIVMTKNIILYSGNNVSSMDVSELTNGVYHVQFSSSSMNTVQTIIKQ